jgi:general secretion pathway protein G
MPTHLFETFRLRFRFQRPNARKVRNGRPIYRAERGTPSRSPRDAGFTILEILVVVTIIGLLIGLVAPAALRQLGGARTSIAKQSIERLGMVLDLYNLDLGSYPTSDQGLEALVRKPSSAAANWNGPYLKSEAVPVDPWNQPYIYRSPSDRPGHAYDLCSKSGNANGGQQTLLCNP